MEVALAFHFTKFPNILRYSIVVSSCSVHNYINTLTEISTLGCCLWPFLWNYFFLCQFQRPRWRESISPEKSMIMVRSTKNAWFAGYCDNTSQILHLLVQPRTQASSRYPSYQRRLGTECDSASPPRTFPTSLTGDVTSEIAEDDWERGCFWWMKSGITPHGTMVGQLYIFIFLFFNKCPFKHANVELQPALA